MKQLIQIVLSFLLWLAVAEAYMISRLHHQQRRQQQQQFSLHMKRKDASAQWDDDDDWKAEDIEVHMPNSLLANFEEDVGKFVTICAIKTYKGYLKNFNDEISQKWLTRFGDDEITPDGLSIKTIVKRPWIDYFETMIKMDPQEFRILVCDLNGRGIKGVRGVKFNSALKDRTVSSPPSIKKRTKSFYLHKLEPRKVASALLTVREDISSELLMDLRCITLENENIKSYAENCLSNGMEYAEKHRKLSRMAELGGSSTPLRDFSYKEIADFVTEMSLTWLKEDNKKEKLFDRGIEVIDEIKSQVENNFQSLSPQERILAWYAQRTTFLEAVYLRALLERQQTSIGLVIHKDELFRTAERLLLYRRVISEETCRIITEQNSICRHFYKMIKDLGGYTKLDLSGEPKIFTVEDNDNDLEDDQGSNVDMVIKELLSPGGSDPATTNNIETTTATEGEIHSPTVPLPINDPDDDTNLMDYEFTQQGPMEM